MASIRIINSSKNNFKKDLKMENNYNFKPFDKVLVRDYDHETWEANFFKSKKEICGKDVLYYCISDVWSQCIPYEGNEHLMDTANMPEITDLKNNILFGIELKVGYVLEFDIFSHEVAIVIPTTKGLAVSYLNGSWEYLVSIYPDKVKSIRGITDKGSFTGGKVLWQKHNNYGSKNRNH